MNTLELSKKTVKVISQKINYDWIHPYKNKTTTQGIGSGFFINDKGYILTCSHVIEHSDKVYIEIPYLGEEKLEVNVVGLCPDLDIALLKTIDYKNEDYYELHNRTHIYTMKPGEDVYAVGFPLGQDNLKFTKGIISGRHFSKIQTDTPINPGNSGGPLLLDDKVLGINASHIAKATNIGYAIPISYFYLIEELLFDTKQKLIKRPYFGISFQNSNQALLDTKKCKCKSGILVKNVFKKAPIAKTGIKNGDIICSINDIEVDNFGLFDIKWFNEKMRLPDITKTIKLNESVNIKYWRGNKLFNKNFKYGYCEYEIDDLYPQFEETNIEYEVFGGMIVMELTNNHLDVITEGFFEEFEGASTLNKRINNILSYLDSSKKTEKKLIITHVFSNSYLQNQKTLFEFDIIDKVNGKKTSTIEEFRKNIKNIRKTKGDKFIEIETEIDTLAVLSLNEIMKIEKEFSEIYKYNLSDLYNYFNKNKTNKKLKTLKRRSKNMPKSKNTKKRK
jgi:S1-C subfamily serine protease